MFPASSRPTEPRLRPLRQMAGTADAMETIARVDLDVDEVRRVVAGARGCIAWNGRLNHSAVDDVMNAITRPLGIGISRSPTLPGLDSNDARIGSIGFFTTP